MNEVTKVTSISVHVGASETVKRGDLERFITEVSNAFGSEPFEIRMTFGHIVARRQEVAL